MILTDGIHLVSTDNEEELHCFARKIGLRRKWFQGERRHPHYDLTTNKKANEAVYAGAYLTTTKDLIRRGMETINYGSTLSASDKDTGK